MDLCKAKAFRKIEWKVLAGFYGVPSASKEVDWSRIGRDVRLTQVLFELLATQILAYHKIEVSHRLVRNLEKELKASSGTGAMARQVKKADWNMMAKRLEAVWTCEQFCDWKDRALVGDGTRFEFPPGNCVVAKANSVLGNSGVHRFNVYKRVQSIKCMSICFLT